MEKIPLPTDNIYKFYALFGLLLLVFSIGGTVALQRGTNETVYRLYVELESIRIAGAAPAENATAREGSPSVREALLKRLIEVAQQDRKSLTIGLSVLAGISIVLIVAGFYMWQTQVQPLQDELLRLQLRRLRGEAGARESLSFRARRRLSKT